MLPDVVSAANSINSDVRTELELPGVKTRYYSSIVIRGVESNTGSKYISGSVAVAATHVRTRPRPRSRCDLQDLLQMFTSDLSDILNRR